MFVLSSLSLLRLLKKIALEEPPSDLMKAKCCRLKPFAFSLIKPILILEAIYPLEMPNVICNQNATMAQRD
jgi:hypothetical protein